MDVSSWSGSEGELPAVGLAEGFFSLVVKDSVLKSKDIVQPEKRGVKRGTNRLDSTSYTIAGLIFPRHGEFC